MKNKYKYTDKNKAGFNVIDDPFDYGRFNVGYVRISSSFQSDFKDLLLTLWKAYDSVKFIVSNFDNIGKFKLTISRFLFP